MKENEVKQTVEVTAEELELLKAAKAEKAKREAQEKRERDLQTYKKLVDEAIAETVPEAHCIQEMLTRTKDAIPTPLPTPTAICVSLWVTTHWTHTTTPIPLVWKWSISTLRVLPLTKRVSSWQIW